MTTASNSAYTTCAMSHVGTAIEACAAVPEPDPAIALAIVTPHRHGSRASGGKS